MMNGFNTSADEQEPQKILVIQQNRSGESKIAGIRKYGGEFFIIETFSIDDPLPGIIDNTDEYLPEKIEADLVLDFLKHPDLSLDLAEICAGKGIPMVASGKKYRLAGIYTPPT
jgi:hypothetical protein